MQSDLNTEESDFSLRIFTSHAREIKFTSFFLTKLSEKHGPKIVQLLFERSFGVYKDMLDLISDFCFCVDSI